jgi:hypothetical protein
VLQWPDQQRENETHDEKLREHPQRLIVNVDPAVTRRERGLGSLGVLRDDHGPRDGRGARRRRQRAVNGAHVIFAEDVRAESGNRRKTSVIHGENRMNRNLEKHPVGLRGEARNQQEEHDLHDEEREIRIAAADVIG